MHSLGNGRVFGSLIKASLTLVIALGVVRDVIALEIMRLQEENSKIEFEVPGDGKVYFLAIGDNKFMPDSITDENDKTISCERDDPVLLALFQDLGAQCWTFPEAYCEKTVQFTSPNGRDHFWRQVLVVKDFDANNIPDRQLMETGKFASALPDSVQSILLSRQKIDSQQTSLIDPIIPQDLEHELPWQTIEAAAWPLDFQKVLLAVPNDPSPAFAYQNGQWFTTWPVFDDRNGAKEDRWFAPALAFGDKLVRPAPLSAETSFVRTASGKLVPQWNLIWHYKNTRIRQSLLSFQTRDFKAAAVFVKFEIDGAPAGTRLALGTGCRLNAHYWDDKTRERTPVPFLAVKSRCVQRDRKLLDQHDRVLLKSRNQFEVEDLGSFEDLLLFTPQADGSVELCTPQRDSIAIEGSESFPDFSAVEAEFQQSWESRLKSGAQARVPSVEWMNRIDAWKTQVDAITRVHYQGRERLSYGAYFYQYYFGIEEAWPVIALAQWNQPREAWRQAEIMLDRENLDKENVHHQSRNGAAPWAAAVVARLTDDREEFSRAAPAMIEAARWTQSVRRANFRDRSPLTQGLLPSHIYGGDVRDPATSLYATAMCWKGMIETADALQRLGDEGQIAISVELRREADDLRQRLFDAMHSVSTNDNGLKFLPFALELPSLNGKHEGPYAALTQSRLGNYWNLFAPSLLQLQLAGSDPREFPQREVFQYMAQRGGLWGSLPRFYNGLDAAYAGGIISYLLHASAVDASYRPQALAALESYFLHAASRNGYTFPEVAGLFLDRLDPIAYERLVREAPWSFGMYDDQQYLEGHISFTEPLGACAGQALSLIREALVTETLGTNSLPDGTLVLLPTVPSDWFSQGKAIELSDFPTAYGVMSFKVESQIDRSGEILMTYRFSRHTRQDAHELKIIRVRFAPPGRPIQEIEFEPQESGEIRCKY